MINFGIRMPSVARFLIGAFLSMGGACSSPTSGVGGESHFQCQHDDQCTHRHPDDFCYEGECTSQIALAGPAPGPCGKSPFVGKYPWKVGNCEAGAVSPVDAATCSSTFCGGNARTPDDCVGDRLAEVHVDGLTMTARWQDLTGVVKHLDCSQLSAADQAECEKLNCELALVKDLYFMNMGRVVSDDLWLLMDEPWPGKETCGDVLNGMKVDLSSCDVP